MNKQAVQAHSRYQAASYSVLEVLRQSQPRLQVHSSIFMSTLQLKQLGHYNTSTQPPPSQLPQELAAVVVG